MLTQSTITLALSPPELARLQAKADSCVAADAVANAEKFSTRALRNSSCLPQGVVDALRAFRRYGSPTGGLLLRSCPTFDLPSTPGDPAAAVGTTLQAAGVFAIISSVLGDHYGFRAELGGNIVQDIVPVVGLERTQQSVSSETELYSHVESAFSDDRPDYIALFCLRADPERAAATTLSPIQSVLPHLSQHVVRVLWQPRFRTKVDASFLRGTNATSPVYVEPIQILSGSKERPRVRADFAETSGLDPAAEAALLELKGYVDAIAVPVKLEAGDMLFVDNGRAFHGRTPFRARFDGSDRWLLRMFLTRDLVRSESHRLNDGRIVDTDHVRPA